MGTLCGERSLRPVLQDLKVTIHESTLVFPLKETRRRSMFLSNIDQVLNFNVETVHFFNANPDFPPQVVTEKLKTALGKVLVPYDFLAGRLKLNQNSGRLEIDCNGGGVGFVAASTDCSLDEVGDLVYPNPAFRQLIVQKLNCLEDGAGQPLCIVQVTSFKCGGFVMGISTNHATFDGISFKLFLQNLASQAFHGDTPLAVPICNDRELLAARTPPRVDFPHPELLKLKLPIGEEEKEKEKEKESSSPPVVFDCPQKELDLEIFNLSSNDINCLKEKAKLSGGIETEATYKITGFNVITAHIWRSKALSSSSSTEEDRLSTVLYAVDIRPRVRPPLPASYTGNAVLTAYATAKCSELQEWPFSKVVRMVCEGAARMTDEYARSAIDWGEIYKGFPHGDFMISSWWRLGFGEVEYPWGKPKYSCPVVYHRKDIILLFPDIVGNGGNSRSGGGGGVNVLVALPAGEMEKFRLLFRESLA